MSSHHSGTVYLLWDNCSPHTVMKDIITIDLPPNTTLQSQPMDQGITQPMDQGITAVLKLIFKLIMLVETFDKWEALQEEAKVVQTGLPTVAQGSPPNILGSPPNILNMC